MGDIIQDRDYWYAEAKRLQVHIAELEREIAEAYRKNEEGTLHVLTCSADHRGPVGNDGCSCPTGRVIKNLRSSRAEEREACAKVVCKFCRDGVPLINGEWHEIEFTDPAEKSRTYCLAYPIRARAKAWMGLRGAAFNVADVFRASSEPRDWFQPVGKLMEAQDALRALETGGKE